MLGILCNSVTVMFITPDVEKIIESLADTYRAHFVVRFLPHRLLEREVLTGQAISCPFENIAKRSFAGDSDTSVMHSATRRSKMPRPRI